MKTHHISWVCTLCNHGGITTASLPLNIRFLADDIFKRHKGCQSSFYVDITNIATHSTKLANKTTFKMDPVQKRITARQFAKRHKLPFVWDKTTLTNTAILL